MFNTYIRCPTHAFIMRSHYSQFRKLSVICSFIHVYLSTKFKTGSRAGKPDTHLVQSVHIVSFHRYMHVGVMPLMCALHSIEVGSIDSAAIKVNDDWLVTSSNHNVVRVYVVVNEAEGV